MSAGDVAYVLGAVVMLLAAAVYGLLVKASLLRADLASERSTNLAALADGLLEQAEERATSRRPRAPRTGRFVDDVLALHQLTREQVSRLVVEIPADESAAFRVTVERRLAIKVLADAPGTDGVLSDVEWHAAGSTPIRPENGLWYGEPGYGSPLSEGSEQLGDAVAQVEDLDLQHADGVAGLGTAKTRRRPRPRLAAPQLGIALGELMVALADRWGVDVDDVEVVHLVPDPVERSVHLRSQLATRGAPVTRDVWVWPPPTP